MGILTTRFEHEGRILWGVVQGQAVVPVGAYASTRDFLERGRPQLGREESAAVPLTEVRLHSPVTRPARVVAQGVNYADHRAARSVPDGYREAGERPAGGVHPRSRPARRVGRAQRPVLP